MSLQELKNKVCEYYMIGLSVLLPLYAVGGWWKLGDTKYFLFRNLTVCCLGIWLVALLVEFIAKSTDRYKGISFCALDKCMTFYAIVVVMSATISEYRHTAWFGFDEWYMGAITQLLLIGIYFLVSRNWAVTGTGRSLCYIFLRIGFGVVVFLGLLHKLGIDPLGLMQGYSAGTWEYSHMLSTIGNMNWFCMYCSMALVPLLTEYYGRFSRVDFVLCAMGEILLLVMGSDTGLLIVGLSLLVGLGVELVQKIFPYKTLLLAGTGCIGVGCFAKLVQLLGERALSAYPADGIRFGILCSGAWWFIGTGMILAVVVWRCFWARVCKILKCRPGVVKAVLAIVSIIICIVVLWRAIPALMQQITVGEHGRFTLWKLAWQSFLQGNWKQRLIGAGPDCYAEYVYSHFAPGELLELDGRWAGAVFANAHNEWLNHLVNMGIIGIVAYFSIIVAAVIRYRRNLMGIFAVMLYLGVSMVGFQQCLSTPVFFMILGICEAEQLYKE